YPMKEIKSTLGVPDHIMFERAIQELDNIDSSKPFFACLMTASDHNPYILPDDIPFKPKSTEISKKIIEYADWAIGKFIEDAKKRQWYENTLFIFVADHGASGSSIYNMSLQYHHIPMIFYAPSQIKPQENRQIALQIDLGPTVLGMLFPDIKANNLGIDLQRQKREYAYFCSDENIGVLDSTYFLIHRISDGDEGLYQYKENDTFNYVERKATRTENMRKYAFSMIQYSFNMLKDRNTSCDK
ncbi:MAG: LTA synthase family protein, partial [Bacteroidales bacterium]|nr:LTA synthase family protein [Bacteroidales bacterium]